MSSKKPNWLKVDIVSGYGISTVEKILERDKLNSVCREARCPNRSRCYSDRTVTFLILGRECTRNCSFCNVSNNSPEVVNLEEPGSIAKAVYDLKLNYVVITSVTRDDLDDGGAKHFVKVINSIREVNTDVGIEVLIPDFNGSLEALTAVIEAKPTVINHNLETVQRLYNKVRSGANYKQSLDLIKTVKKCSNITTKSGIILGLGEKDFEIRELLMDLRSSGCDLLTIGQYLSPSKRHTPVDRYITPDEFNRWRDYAISLGFKRVLSNAFVRSSYKANTLVDNQKV